MSNLYKFENLNFNNYEHGKIMTKEEAFKILREKEQAIENAKAAFEEWKEYCLTFAKFKLGQKIKIICDDKKLNGKIGFIYNITIKMPYWKDKNISICYTIAKVKKDGIMSKFNFSRWNDFKEEDLVLMEE